MSAEDVEDCFKDLRDAVSALQSALADEVGRLTTENERFKRALEHIARMRTMPDHKLNTQTLVAAHSLALEALKGVSDVHLSR